MHNIVAVLFAEASRAEAVHQYTAAASFYRSDCVVTSDELQTIEERERRRQEELAEQAKEEARLQSRKVNRQGIFGMWLLLLCALLMHQDVCAIAVLHDSIQFVAT